MHSLENQTQTKGWKNGEVASEFIGQNPELYQGQSLPVVHVA